MSKICAFIRFYCLESRIKRTARHKPFWHSKKLNKAIDEPLTSENQAFVQDYMDHKYNGPLREEFTPWARGTWQIGSRDHGPDFNLAGYPVLDN